MESIWMVFLRSMYTSSNSSTGPISKRQKEIWFELTRALLLHGAEPQGRLDLLGGNSASVSSVMKKISTVAELEHLLDALDKDRKQASCQRYHRSRSCSYIVSDLLLALRERADPLWRIAESISYRYIQLRLVSGREVENERAENIIPSLPSGPTSCQILRGVSVNGEPENTLQIPSTLMAVSCPHHMMLDLRNPDIILETRYSKALCGSVKFKALTSSSIYAEVVDWERPNSWHTILARKTKAGLIHIAPEPGSQKVEVLSKISEIPKWPEVHRNDNGLLVDELQQLKIFLNAVKGAEKLSIMFEQPSERDVTTFERYSHFITTR